MVRALPKLKRLLTLLALMLPLPGHCMLESYGKFECIPELGYFLFIQDAICAEVQHEVGDFKKLWDKYNILTTTWGDYYEYNCPVTSGGIKVRVRRVFENPRCIGQATTDFKLYMGENLIYDGEISRGCQDTVDLDVIKYELGFFTFLFRAIDPIHNIQETYTIEAKTHELELAHIFESEYPVPITLDYAEKQLDEPMQKLYKTKE